MKTLKREIDKRGKTLKTITVEHIYSEFFQCKARPKILLEDLGELYQSDTFEGFEVTHLWLPNETLKYKFNNIPVPQKAKTKRVKNVSMEQVQNVEPATFDTAITVSEGLTKQIPGRAYKERNTDEIFVFLGYETMCMFGSGGRDSITEPKYLYLRLEDINRQVKEGGLKLKPMFEMNSCYVYWNIKTASKPKVMVEDIGKVFDERFFKNFHYKNSAFEIFVGGEIKEL